MTRSGMEGAAAQKHTWVPQDIQLYGRPAAHSLRDEKQLSSCIPHPSDQLPSMQPEIEIFSALVTTLLIKPTLLQHLSNLRE